MFLNSKSPTYKRLFLDDYLAALTTVPSGALLVTPKLHLWTGALAINPELPIASFTALEATFTGYAAIALTTFTGPVTNFVNTRAKLATGTFTLGSSPTVTQSVNGYWIDQGATVDWVIAEAFAQPVPFASPGDFLDLSVLIGLAMINQLSL